MKKVLKRFEKKSSEINKPTEDLEEEEETPKLFSKKVLIILGVSIVVIAVVLGIIAGFCICSAINPAAIVVSAISCM